MHKYLFLASCALVVPVAANAQEAAEDQPLVLTKPRDEAVITVVATGTAGDVTATGQPVTVIGDSELRAVQGPDLTRALERVPGLTVSRNGGLGAFTGVRLRGAEAEQTLVVLDGVRVADTASPGGGFDFGTLTTGNLAKIEVLRASNSTIWGSDAIGGVVVASTRASRGLVAEAEYGSRNTLSSALSGGIAGTRGFLGLSATYLRTDGFSAAASGTEADGFEHYALGGDGRLYISDALELFARARWAKGTLDIDGFPAPTYQLADTGEVQETRQLSASAGAEYDRGPLFLNASFSRAETERENRDPAAGPTFSSTGTSDRLALRGEWRPFGPLLVHFGGEHEWTGYETLYDSGAKARIFGAYAQLGIEFGALSARAGGRVDQHDRFGSATSFGADLSYTVAPDLRVRASIGEGFKAPTLFQLFSDYGNEALQPETSTSIDLGLTLGDRVFERRAFYGAATVFRRESENQIEFASCFGSTAPLCATRPFGYYDNIGRVRAQGFELELGARPVAGFIARAAYAYVDAENRTPGSTRLGNALARRPRHALTLSADWQVVTEGLALGADVRLVSDSFDDAANLTRLDGFEVVTLRAAMPVGERFELFGRIENLFDQHYQTAAGYSSTPRGVFAGARVKL